MSELCKSLNISKDSDILLIIPPPFSPKMPSVGIAYLTTFLKNKGFKASVFDMSLKLHNIASEELKRFWQMDCTNSFFVTEIAENLYKAFYKDIVDFIDEILTSNIRIIGFSVNIISIFLANKIAKLIKEKDLSRIIIFGGPGTFFKHPRQLIKPNFVDIFVIGEGEEVTLKIVDSILKDKKIESGPGILLGVDLEQFNVIPSIPIKDINSIPFPTFSEFDLREYNQSSDYKPLPLLLSRGCIKRCSYCIDYIMWPGFRFRSPENVFEEIKYHIQINKVKTFEFNDLTCNGNLKQLSKICDLIIESGLRFNWVSYAIIRKDMNYELLLKMKKAGCHTLIYGVESGSDSILRKMNKDYTARDASELIRMTKESGICTNVNLIVGFPGETEDDFNQTVNFLYQNRDYIDEVTNVSGCTLFPEAEIGYNREKYGVIWREGTDPMLFRDTNGVDRHIRNQRVEKLLNIINEIGLSKSIVNQPKLNSQVVEWLKKKGDKRYI